MPIRAEHLFLFVCFILVLIVLAIAHLSYSVVYEPHYLYEKREYDFLCFIKFVRRVKGTYFLLSS